MPEGSKRVRRETRMYAQCMIPRSRGRRLVPWAAVVAVGVFAFVASPSGDDSRAGDGSTAASLVTSRPVAVTPGVPGIRSNLDLRHSRDQGPRPSFSLHPANAAGAIRLAAFSPVVAASPAGLDILATALVVARAPPAFPTG